MKFALGTVQFGLPYGVANTSGCPVNFEEVKEILALAKNRGIKTLDTAIAYGDSEKVLGEVGVKDWELITKLPKVPLQCTDVFGWVISEIKGSLRRLKVEQLYGVLLHHPQDLMSESGAELVRAMKHIKAEGLGRKIGVSLYEPSQLSEIEDHIKLDIVQGPVSIFDRRFIDSGAIKKLHAQGIEFHARSIFLQGLLLMDQIQRPKFFQQFSSAFKKWDEWISNKNISRMEACLRYLNDFSEIDRVVIGVDSAPQLNTILNCFNSQGLMPPLFVDSLELNLLNPALWRAE
jgi:aryl-alcohol dehydrogenase-like predicted oxidoreductase